ncbi:MAG TPA: diguanylate cyclase [Erythrobacter sp.]|nr:diguanylate cyclase [Erythrobacter sp.]
MAEEISAPDVIGLRGPRDARWAKLRSLQFSATARFALSRLLGHLIFGVLVAAIFYPAIEIQWLSLWVASIGIVSISSFLIDRKLDSLDHRSLTNEEFNSVAARSILAGAIWSVPILFFAPLGNIEDLLTLWLVMSVMAMLPTLLAVATPLGNIAFLATTGIAAVVGFVRLDLIEVAVVAMLFQFLSALGNVEIARTYLAAKLAQMGVAEKEEVVSLLLRENQENEADWLWQVDTLRRVRSVSPRFAFALGCDQKEAEGKPLLDLIAGSAESSSTVNNSIRELSESLKSRQNFSNLVVKVEIGGEARCWQLSGTPIINEYGVFVGFRGVGSDVTEQRKSSEKIAYLARYDTLTSLPNRLQLTEALGDALAYAENWRTRCAFMMVDLDRFKAVNDTLGHLVGDKLLAQVSLRLKSLMGEGQMCGRLGGDEFAIVMNDASDGKVIRDLALTVIERLSEPYTVDNHTLYVGASVGSAMGPRDGKSVEEIMRNADLALYRAKDGGGGEHRQFEPALHAVAEERRRLEDALRSALDRDELLLQFQPVVSADTGELVSFEALVRWQSSELGFVSPAKFIPLAEDTRQIIEIGRWVLQNACMEARNWPDHVKVNINVSPEQLLEPTFTDEVVSALASTGLRPERLEIEVTESIFLRDASVARAALEQIMALGCSVAMDDFGTGYSSLGYLRKLHFSTIKVDRSFVEGAVQGNPESLAIIRAVVAMAQSLDMSTTAEGVETQEQAELVRSLGCDKIQGYHFGRPMSALDARSIFSPSDYRKEA